MDNDHQDSETPNWSINPALPKAITKVFIEEIMLPVLVMATLNLIAQGLHLDASKNDPKPHPPPNQGHVASSTRVEGAEELQVSQAVKVLREKYISFLAEALPGLSHLAQSELLEDDALETAFFHGVEDGKSIPAALAVAAKCEIDRWAGPACGIGPTGLQCLFDQLGLDIGLATLAEVRRDKRLPKPCTLVNDSNHWVPMRLKTHGQKFHSRPWLREESYDTYLEKLGPVAEAAGAWADCTSRAAGDCGFHGFLILQNLASAVPADREPPEGENPLEWPLEDQAVWKMEGPRRIVWMKFGRAAAGWWSCKRTGAKIGRGKSAQEACQLFLGRSGR
jgi:hypothetical protein